MAEEEHSWHNFSRARLVVDILVIFELQNDDFKHSDGLATSSSRQNGGETDAAINALSCILLSHEEFPVTCLFSFV